MKQSTASQLAYYDNTASFQACQTQCLNNANCKIFQYGTNNSMTYNPDINRCWLYSTVSVYQIQQGYLMSPRTCT